MQGKFYTDGHLGKRKEIIHTSNFFICSHTYIYIRIKYAGRNPITCFFIAYLSHKLRYGLKSLLGLIMSSIFDFCTIPPQYGFLYLYK